MDSLRQAFAERILILDGAMGTMLQRHGLSGNNETRSANEDYVLSAHSQVAYIDVSRDVNAGQVTNVNRSVCIRKCGGNQITFVIFHSTFNRLNMNV